MNVTTLEDRRTGCDNIQNTLDLIVWTDRLLEGQEKRCLETQLEVRKYFFSLGVVGKWNDLEVGH